MVMSVQRTLEVSPRYHRWQVINGLGLPWSIRLESMTFLYGSKNEQGDAIRIKEMLLPFRSEQIY